MFVNMLRRLCRALSPFAPEGPRAGCRPGRRRGTCRPLVEALETRLTPSGDFGFAFSLTGGFASKYGGSLSINAVAADRLGNVYVTGRFYADASQPADFDPGPGVVNLTSTGTGYPPTYDVFVAKYTRAGALVWAHHVGTPDGSAGGSGVAVDYAGDVYVSGSFQGTADFDPGPGTFNLTALGQTNGFVLKLDTGGDFLWARQVGLGGGGIAVDGAANAYTTDGGAVTKLDTAGNFLWARALVAGAIAADGAGNVYITAGGGATVMKLDTGGNTVWSRQLAASNIAVDTAGNVYAGGSFTGTVDFDPGPGTFDLTSTSSRGDGFVEKLDSGGNFVWARQFATANGSASVSTVEVAVDGGGNVYTTGGFQGTVDFDPGPGTFDLTSAGSGDAFVVKLDSGGNFAWARQFAPVNFPPWYAVGGAIALDSLGDIDTVGSFVGTVNFDPGPGTYDLNGSGGFLSSNSGYVSQLRDNNVYANPAWSGKAAGTDPDGEGPATAMGVDAFATAQAAINAAPDGGTVNLAPGTYYEGLTLSQSVHLIGSGSASTVLAGPTTDPAYLAYLTGYLTLKLKETGQPPPNLSNIPPMGTGLVITAPGVEVSGLTVRAFNQALSARGPSYLSLADVRLQGNTVGGNVSGVPTLAFGGTPGDDTLYVTPSALALDGDNPLFFTGVRSFTVDGGGGNDRLVVQLNDTGAAETVWLTAGALSRDTTPFLLYYRDTAGAFGQGVAVVLGDGSDVAVMQSQLAWTPTAVYGGAGDDVFYVAASQTSDYAGLTLDGGGGSNSWGVYDQSGGAVLHTLGHLSGAWVYQILYADGASSLLACQNFDQYLGALPVL